MYTNYLFADPNFILGVAKVIDLSGSLNEYNYAITPEMGDNFATMSDWLSVGGDIISAVENYDKKE